jgi:hypothetical protein
MAMDRTECRSCWDLGDLDSKRAKLAPDSRSVISQRNPNSLPFSWSPFTKWTVRPSGPSVDPISAGARRDFDRGEFGLAQLSHQRVLQLVADSCVTGATEMRVDGFRFDLATILAREPYGFDEGGDFSRRLPARPGRDAYQLNWPAARS